MDGVIVDSEPRHERAFQEVMRELGYGDTHGIHFADYIGRRDNELWLDFQARHNPPHTIEELRERKRCVVVELLRREQPLFAGLPELVEKLAARVPLALASGSERAIVEEVLELGGLRSHFQVTLSAADVTQGKPDPQIFLLAATRLGVAPVECWVIEDSKPGVAAALAANMRVIAITNSHPAAELQAATAVVSTYAEIERLLGVA